MKHIVFVCQVFYPDSTSTSQLFTDLFQHLTESGVKVSVVCGFPARLPGIQTAPPPRYEHYQGMDIYRCGLGIDTKKSYLARTMSYLSLMVHAAWRILRIPGKDIVFGVTNPPFVVHLLWLLSRLQRFRYDYMFLDVYPEGLVALGNLKRTSFITRLWMMINKVSYARAERLAVLGRDMVPLLCQNYGLDATKITYIPHWSAADVTEPMTFANNPMARHLGLQEKFVVQYSGNMGLWHDMETFVYAAQQLQADSYIHFLFIGGGIRRKSAQELSKRLGLDNITWLDFVPLEQLPESLTCCHVSLISLNKGLDGVAVPCKIYGILASGRAIIAQVPKESEVAYTVEEEQCGIVVEPGNVPSLVAAIQSIAQNEHLTREMGERAFAAYYSKYTVDKAVVAFTSFWEITRYR
jgi:glycosyltransferase involved in cell wall biosynthesis